MLTVRRPHSHGKTLLAEVLQIIKPFWLWNETPESKVLPRIKSWLYTWSGVTYSTPLPHCWSFICRYICSCLTLNITQDVHFKVDHILIDKKSSKGGFFIQKENASRNNVGKTWLSIEQYRKRYGFTFNVLFFLLNQYISQILDIFLVSTFHFYIFIYFIKKYFAHFSKLSWQTQFKVHKFVNIVLL